VVGLIQAAMGAMIGALEREELELAHICTSERFFMAMQ
jgi:hypothetical protein